jgi:hypothetical protein
MHKGVQRFLKKIFHHTTDSTSIKHYLRTIWDTKGMTREDSDTVMGRGAVVVQAQNMNLTFSTLKQTSVRILTSGL